MYYKNTYNVNVLNRAPAYNEMWGTCFIFTKSGFTALGYWCISQNLIYGPYMIFLKANRWVSFCVGVQQLKRMLYRY